MRRTLAIVTFVMVPIIAQPAHAGLEKSDAKHYGDSPAAVITSQPEVRDARAQRDLGLRYLNGDGVIKNEAAAFMWIRSAADQGLPEAQSDLGLLYGKGYGVTRDEREAVEWFRKAAEHGSS